VLLSLRPNNDQLQTTTATLASPCWPIPTNLSAASTTSNKGVRRHLDIRSCSTWHYLCTRRSAVPLQPVLSIGIRTCRYMRAAPGIISVAKRSAATLQPVLSTGCSNRRYLCHSLCSVLCCRRHHNASKLQFRVLGFRVQGVLCGRRHRNNPT